MMKVHWIIGLLTATAFAACAYPDIQYRSDDPSGPASSASSSSSSSSAGGAGGAGGATESATATSSTQTSSSAGGAGPCDLLDSGACSAGQKCSIVNETTGERGCMPAGNNLLYSACDTDADCEPTTYCDPLARSCKKFCATNAQCSNSRPCVSIPDSNGDAIPNVGICLAPCEPLSGSPCDVNSTNCVPIALKDQNDVQFLDWDCAKAGDKKAGEKCNNTASCSHGLHCYDPNVTFNGDECVEWCKEGDPCGALTGCKLISVKIGQQSFPVTYQGEKYGACDAL